MRYVDDRGRSSEIDEPKLPKCEANRRHKMTIDAQREIDELHTTVTGETINIRGTLFIWKCTECDYGTTILVPHP